jgi:hypothetical protein
MLPEIPSIPAHDFIAYMLYHFQRHWHAYAVQTGNTLRTDTAVSNIQLGCRVNDSWTLQEDVSVQTGSTLRTDSSEKHSDTERFIINGFRTLQKMFLSCHLRTCNATR